MSTRRVWAPSAAKVDLVTASGRVPMTKESGGWWRVELADDWSRSDYAFILDGGPPLPDPRSPWQPHGVHGFSRPVDHSSSAWSDSGWQPAPLSSAIIYECHVGTFTSAGTFDAAVERLSYLRELGVTHLEIMPVGEFPGTRGWGYDGVDLYAPNHGYGGPDAMKRLVDACHANGIGVILDVVYNHFGPDGNYLRQFGPYLTNRYVTPWGQAINLDDAGSSEVRRYLCDNALMWMRDYHVDGLRIDAIHAIFDASVIHFLEQLASEVEALSARLGRHLILIAESDLNQPRVVVPREAGGYGIDAQWSDDFHHALHALLSGERDSYYADFGALADLAKSLTRVFVNDGGYSRFRRRNHGRPIPSGLLGHRFVGFLQNHDQVGNRAKGERIGHLISVDRLKVASALLFASPFIPMLFQGEEWNASSPFQYFTDHTDPGLADAVSKGRRAEFPESARSEVPDPQSAETFQRSKLDWSERERGDHRDVLQWYRALIAMRRSVPDLADGRLERTAVSFDEAARWLWMRRGACVVACNLAATGQRISLDTGSEQLVIALASKSEARLEAAAVYLPPVSVAILTPTQLAD
ncbi:MAG TPA: malto-oligosyltrehalose trehalohydrolase [Candidatus Binataceae bacterium]